MIKFVMGLVLGIVFWYWISNRIGLVTGIRLEIGFGLGIGLGMGIVIGIGL